MIGLLARLAGGPVLIIGLPAALVSGLSGQGCHLTAAAVALALILPPGVLAAWLVQRQEMSAYGRVAIVMLTSILRLVLGFGGGVALFFLCRHSLGWGPLCFWGWLLGA
ncbi:MAG: hypothetical protein NZ703_15565, partial [Gemmataceae bacterium]|nr:hypothetical protein [Gemmataceae bacterium]